MDKQQFKAFCKNELEARGFRKAKDVFYMAGQDLLCGITLQKSNYGNAYYINYYYWIGEYHNPLNYPSIQSSDIEGRIKVMSKTQTHQGKNFMTTQIRYEEYAEAELKPYIATEFETVILPPVGLGKSYILTNLQKLYFLTLNQDVVMKKLLN